MSTIKVWDGSSWQSSYPKVWAGSTWVPANIGVWDGAAWGSTGGAPPVIPGGSIDVHDVTVAVQSYGSYPYLVTLYGYDAATPQGSISAGSPSTYTITSAYFNSYTISISIAIVGSPTTWNSVTIGTTNLTRASATFTPGTSGVWTWYAIGNLFGTIAGATKTLTFFA